MRPWCVLLLSLASLSAALPARTGPLPDFDVRQGGTVPPLVKPRAAPTDDEVRLPSEVQLGALAALEARLGPGLVARFGGRGTLPRVLFHRDRALGEPRFGRADELALDFLRQERGVFGLDDEAIAGLALVRERTLATSGAHQLLFVQQHGGVLVYHGELRVVVGADGAVLWVSASEIQAGLAMEWSSRIEPYDAARAIAAACGRELTGVVVGTVGGADASPVFRSEGLRHPLVLRPVLLPARGAAMPAWMGRVLPAGSTEAYSVLVEARDGRLLVRRDLVRDRATWPDGEEATDESDRGTARPVRKEAGKASRESQAREKERFRVLWDAGEALVGAIDPPGGDGPAPFDEPCAEPTLRTALDETLRPLRRWKDGLHRLGLDDVLDPGSVLGGDGTSCTDPHLRIELVPLAQLPPRKLVPWNVTVHDLAGGGGVPCGEGMPAQLRVAMPRVTDHCGRGLPLDARGLLHAASHVVVERVAGAPFDDCLGGPQSAAIDEAFSDLLAATYGDEMHTLDALGRPAPPLAGDPGPLDYGALCAERACDPLHVGRLLSAPLWSLGRVGEQGGARLAADALAFLPCGASLADARDALLLADRTAGGARRCTIQESLARFGLGFEAAGSDGAWARGDGSSEPACTARAHPVLAGHTLREEDRVHADGLFAPDETLELYVALDNRLGRIDASPVRVTVASLTEGVSVLTAEQDVPAIPVGGLRSNPEPLRLAIERGFVCGRPLDLELTIRYGVCESRVERLVIDEGHVPAAQPLYEIDFEREVPLSIEGAARVRRDGPAASGQNSLFLDAGCSSGEKPTCEWPTTCDGNCTRVETGLIRLPADRTATLSLAASYRLEPLRDGVWVEVTRDEGASWEPLASADEPSELFFTDEPGDCLRPAGVRRAISGPPLAGERTGWQPFRFSLADYAGETVRLRLISHHDRCVYLEGTWVDDVRVTPERCAGVPE